MNDKQLEELRHKAEQYDDVVAWLRAADGGQYRADVISALRRRLEIVVKARATMQDAYDHLQYLSVFDGKRVSPSVLAQLRKAMKDIDALPSEEPADG